MNGRGRQVGRRTLSSVPLLVLTVVVLSLFGTLVARLGTVQVVDGPEYVAAAADANTRTIVVPAVRGRILDRHGAVLAGTTTSVVVTVDRATLLHQADGGLALVRRLALALGQDPTRVWERTVPCGSEGAARPPACWAGSPYAPIPVAERVDPTRALAVAEQVQDYPGVDVEAASVRTYPRPEGVSMAQVLGYVGGPTAAQVTAAHGAISSTDAVGLAGLERQYDAALRGTPGRVVLAVDPQGTVLREVSRTAPVPGRDLVTNLDVSVQAAAETALAERVGALRAKHHKADSAAAVVLDTRTGAVVASASYPAYDPNVWNGGISSRAYATLTGPASGTPLVNRVTESTYPPASTFKVISLTAAVAGGADLHGTYPCPSSYTIGDRAFHNFESEAYGRIDLERAIVVSCDTVFYRLAFQSWQRLGGLSATSDAGDPFVAYARSFGIGRPTGIDLPAESGGRLPDRAWKQATWDADHVRTCERARTGYPDVARTDPRRAVYLKAVAAESCRSGYRLKAGDAANFAIGQGDVAATPLQMGVVYAAVANGGTTVTPRIGQALVDPSGIRTPVAAGPTTRVGLPAGVDAYLRRSLRAAVVTGTSAGNFRGFPTDWPVAGKTGTGEILGQQEVSWFASYAPANSPRYAVTAVISQGGTGGGGAAWVNRRIQAALRLADRH